ncbi:arylsulfatase A-like enzyme [Streptomyces canus]|uniref:Arylsulfatase A-like enzyme n=1 Tax=Streptomyces canus TaxID=58343 RepID=A0AAW8FXE5_9ACTN|nr:sulfatase-like hydrolase/transferase [Streptomyces canus]MDQ0913702.1 arylsulfatase A-like enzyme [Streptomyces canus]
MRSWSPGARGFERFHGFLGAETSQRYPDLVHDNHPVEQPTMPEDGYHFSTDITDKALEFIGDVKAIAPDRPVFLYYAPGRGHAPRQVPREWIERYRGRFDAGDEALREQTMARRKETGLLPQNTELPPLNPIGTL